MSGVVNSDEEKQRVAEQRERKKKKKRAMKEAGKQKLVGEASVQTLGDRVKRIDGRRGG